MTAAGAAVADGAAIAALKLICGNGCGRPVSALQLRAAATGGIGLHSWVERFGNWCVRYSIAIAAVAAVADGLQMAFRWTTRTGGQALKTQGGLLREREGDQWMFIGRLDGSTSLFQLLLLRAASASAGTVAETAAAPEPLSRSNLRAVRRMTRMIEGTLEWSD